MFRGNATHTARMRARAAPVHRSNGKFPTGDRIVSSPVYDNKVVYFGGDDGNIYASMRKQAGRFGKRTTDGPVPSTPAVANGTVYAGSYDGKFYALNTQTGALKWKFKQRASGGSKPKACMVSSRRIKQLPISRRLPLESGCGGGRSYFGSGDGISTHSMQIPVSCAGSSRRAMWVPFIAGICNGGLFFEAGTVTSTRSSATGKENGVSTAAK